MRFFEFKITPGSNTVSDLIDLVKDPTTSDDIKTEVEKILLALEQKSDKTNEDMSADTVAEIESDEAYYQRILNSDPRLKKAAENILKKAEAESFKIGQALGGQEALPQLKEKIASAIDQLPQLEDNLHKKAVQSAVRDLILDGEISQDLVFEFLEKCSTPDRIFDLSAVVSNAPVSNIKPIPEKYQAICKTIGRLTPGSSSSATGKGELLCILAGKGTKDQKTKGDINVDNKLIEVKASDVGAKTISDFVFGGKMPTKDARKILVDTLNSELGRTVFIDALATQENKEGIKGISAIGVKNLKTLNRYFQEIGQEKTREMFKNMFEAVVGNEYTEEIQEIIQSIDSNGVNQESYFPPLKKLMFKYYKNVNGHDGILTINVPSLSFDYTEEAENFENLDNVTITYLFDFRPVASSITSFKRKD